MDTNQGAQDLGEVLDERGWSQSHAERELKMTRGHMSRILSGERLPGRALAVRIHRLCGVSPGAWDAPAGKGKPPLREGDTLPDGTPFDLSGTGGEAA